MDRTLTCKRCEAGFTADSDAAVVDCPYCNEPHFLATAQFKRDQAESEVLAGHYQSDISECHQCGAEMSFHVDKQEVACNFCGNSIDLRKTKRIEAAQPEKLVTFKAGESDFYDKALSHIADSDYVPLDIFQSIKFDETLGAFIPTYEYSGRYSADYNASIGYHRTEHYTARENGKTVTKTRTVTDWHPHSGSVSGVFQLNACASKFLQEEEKSFVESLETGSFVDNEEGYVLGFAVEPIRSDFDHEQLYEDRVKSRVNSIIDRDVEGSLPGDTQKNISWSASISKYETHFLYPIWHVSFTYKEKIYRIVGDGQDIKNIHSSLPKDENREKAAKYPLYAAGALIAISVLMFFFGDAKDITRGLFWSGTAYLGFAFANGALIRKRGDEFRFAALECFKNNQSFDCAGELLKRKKSPFNDRNIQIGGVVLAIVVFVIAMNY